MRGNKIVKNASWIIVCRILQSIFALIINMITARYLGPSNYGIISYAASVVAFILPLVQLGLRNTLVEEIISNPEREGKTLGTAILMCIFSSFAGIIGIAAFTSIVNAGESDTIIVCVLYSISLIFQMTEMIQYWFQAKLLSKYTSVVSLAAYVIVSLYKIYLLVSAKNIYWFSVANGLDFLLISVSLYVIYKKLSEQKLSFSFNVMKEIFTRSKYYIVSGMMVTIFAQTDRIMLKNMINDAENGFYSAAIYCAGMTGFVFQAIIDSFRPLIFECKKKKNETAYLTNMTRLYSVIMYMGIIQSVVLTAFAPIIINILYGASYSPSVILLQIVTWYSSFSYMGSVRNIWILAEEKQKYLWIINLLGALLNVIGNLVLIPLLSGIGAAIATVATQFFTNFVLCFIIKPTRPTGFLILKALNPKVLISLIKK